MSGKMGKQQSDFLQYSKKMIAILETIKASEDEVKKAYIAENAIQIRAIGESFLEIVKAFGDMKDYVLLKSINDESLRIPWTDAIGFEHAYKYVENLLKVAHNVIEIAKHSEQKTCLCCQERVYFIPSSPQFLEICGTRGTMPESARLNEQICPNCMSNDRDRAIVCFLKQVGLDQGNKPVQVLSFAPSRAIERWIYGQCPAVQYQSVDIGLDGKVDPDLSQIAGLPDKSYDYFFCPDVLLYGKLQDTLADELIRILKEDGLCLVSAPISAVSKSNHEGQDFLDIRFMKKLRDAGFLFYQWTQDTHQGDVFADHAVLYILTKIKNDIGDIILQRAADRYDGSLEKPLVSVIMSVYNHEKYVSRAIESVLSQGYENIEFLVADDCSMDGSADEILKYKEQIDGLYLFEENGFGRIPFLLSIAKGKYIAVLDSDDYWEPDKIEQQVLYMETHPECGACFTGVRCIDQNDKESDISAFVSENRSSAEWLHYFYQYGNCLAYSSVMIKKEIHIQVMNHASNFSIVPDYIMWLHVALDYDIHLIEKELLNYRWHESNDSKETGDRIKNQYFEETYCWLEVMKKMDPALFVKAFRAYLTDPDVTEPKEILCEKALVLLKSEKSNFRLAGLFYCYEFLSDPENKKIMQEKYHLGRREIFEILNRI